MGVQGLLGSLKSIQKASHLRDLAGKTVAVDAYGWLHRGSVACAVELVTGKPTRKYVDFAMHRVHMLQHFGLTPYLVFDGDRLPSKATTEAARQARREECKARGIELLNHGRSKEAHQELQKAVDITPEMARLLIEELRRLNIRYVVAPYEADSQMVFLERKGIVDAIVSEDSDLLVFGAQCLITKLDQYGECVIIKRSQFTACREMNLTNWTDSEFRCMAILSGCDYLEGLPRMGIKTAHRYVRKYKTIDRIIRGAQFEGKIKVPMNYLESYRQADLTFLHQWVFCPEEKALVHFTPLETDVDPTSLHFIGARTDDATSRKIALGDLDPITKSVLAAPQPSLTSRDNRPMFISRPSTHPTAAENESLKESKKLMEGFLIKRQPLAELDPNTMQHTDSQRSLLRAAENGRPWSASTAPLSRMVTGSASRAAPRPPAPRVTSGTGAREPKRRRLCMDDRSSPSKADKPAEQSPFFAKPTTNHPTLASPSVLTKAQRKRHKSFELWSDDSIEGAMREMEPKCGSVAVESEKLAVFNDSAGHTSKPTAPAKLTDPTPASPSIPTTNRNGDQPGTQHHTSTSHDHPQDPEPTLLAAAFPSRNPKPLSQVESTPLKQTTKNALLQHFSFKGSEDALIPESDVDESASSPAAAASSDISEPNTPTAKKPLRNDAALKRSTSGRHILDLEQFVYGAQPLLRLGSRAQ